MKNLTATALERRLSVLEMVYNGKSGHIGGSMGCMDILTVIYDVMMDVDKIKAGDPDRDRFVMSKGHCAEALYAVLADVGLIEREELKTYAKYNTRLAEHPTHSGVEAATGALGHGLSLAVGMAYGLKQSGSPAKVYTLMGDGEQAEGSVWEAAMSAAKFKLDNLTAVVDRNYLQISGGTEEVMIWLASTGPSGSTPWSARATTATPSLKPSEPPTRGSPLPSSPTPSRATAAPSWRTRRTGTI